MEAAAISSKQLLSYLYRAEWTPFQTHYFSENRVAPGIKPKASQIFTNGSDGFDACIFRVEMEIYISGPECTLYSILCYVLLEVFVAV
jgi:hypothetical protein